MAHTRPLLRWDEQSTRQKIIGVMQVVGLLAFLLAFAVFITWVKRDYMGLRDDEVIAAGLRIGVFFDLVVLVAGAISVFRRGDRPPRDPLDPGPFADN
jgi:hypothetical protein